MMKTVFATARTFAGASTVGAVKTLAVKTRAITAGLALQPRQ